MLAPGPHKGRLSLMLSLLVVVSVLLVVGSTRTLLVWVIQISVYF